MTFKNSDGYHWEKTYDEKGNVLTEHENGKLTIDNRKKVKEITQEEMHKALKNYYKCDVVIKE